MSLAGKTPVLETDRLILRAPEPRDLEAWMAFLVSERGTWHGGGPEQGAGRAWRMVATLFGHWQLHGYGTFNAMRRSDGAFVASVGPFFPPDWPEREIGWSVLRAEDEGKGYAAEAARAVLLHLFRDLGWTTVVSYIHPDNARSIALAERLGAVRDPDAARPVSGDIVFRHAMPAEAAA